MSEKAVEDQAAEQVIESSEEAAAPVDNVRPMDQAKKKVTAAVGDAREKFQHAAADVGDRFHKVSANAQEEFRHRSQHVREQARERYQATSERMQDVYSRGRQEAEYRLDDVNDFVRHKPGTAILIAAGAGFLLGLLFRPRRYED